MVDSPILDNNNNPVGRPPGKQEDGFDMRSPLLQPWKVENYVITPCHLLISLSLLKFFRNWLFIIIRVFSKIPPNLSEIKFIYLLHLEAAKSCNSQQFTTVNVNNNNIAGWNQCCQLFSMPISSLIFTTNLLVHTFLKRKS